MEQNINSLGTVAYKHAILQIKKKHLKNFFLFSDLLDDVFFANSDRVWIHVQSVPTSGDHKPRTLCNSMVRRKFCSTFKILSKHHVRY